MQLFPELFKQGRPVPFLRCTLDVAAEAITVDDGEPATIVGRGSGFSAATTGDYSSVSMDL